MARAPHAPRTPARAATRTHAHVTRPGARTQAGAGSTARGPCASGAICVTRLLAHATRGSRTRITHATGRRPDLHAAHAPAAHAAHATQARTRRARTHVHAHTPVPESRVLDNPPGNPDSSGCRLRRGPQAVAAGRSGPTGVDRLPGLWCNGNCRGNAANLGDQGELVPVSEIGAQYAQGQSCIYPKASASWNGEGAPRAIRGLTGSHETVVEWQHQPPRAPGDWKGTSPGHGHVGGATGRVAGIEPRADMVGRRKAGKCNTASVGTVRDPWVALRDFRSG